MHDASPSRFTATSLRAAWQRRSLDANWSFPGDWYCPAVDALCESLTLDTDAVRASAARLGRDRASLGIALAEALADIDVLAELVPVRADTMRRAVCLGWADQSAAGADAVVDPLTGLSTIGYLQARLQEIYRASVLSGEPVGRTHALVIVRFTDSFNPTWAQSLPMITVARSLETVFSSGQSLVRLGTVVAAVLAARNEALPRQAKLLADILTKQLSGAGRTTAVRDDGAGAVPTRSPIRVWIESLPDAYTVACDLLGSLRR